MNPIANPDRSSGAAAEGAKIIDQQHADTGGPGPEVMAARTLKGNKVVNFQNEDLGEIEDIMLDVKSGRIAYAVLAFGGIMGLGEKFFAIPWSALTLDADRECFILDIDRHRLENAPGFDKSHWPSMADQTWANEVYRYYNQRPYWEHQ